MKLIIDIPGELAKEGRWYTDKQIWIVINAVQNGIPLPKGHGRILDEKEILNTEKHDGGWYDLVDLPEYIAGVSAIVEADTTESEDRCKNCEYFHNPDYTRCHECKAESEAET